MQSVFGSGFLLCILSILVTASYRNQLKFYLTNSNNNAWEIHPNKESIEAANFMFRKLTVMMIHDYADNTNGSFNKVITEALKETRDLNIITVDWTPYSRNENESYMNVNLAGYEISVILYTLCEDFKYSPKKIHIIGLGAGAHVAGVAGRLFADSKIGIIRHITGLDPIGFKFSRYNGSEKITLKTDSARFVEVIHTNIQAQSGDVGYKKPLGHLDFYPNGGRSMPGCENSNHALCSHHMSYKYLAEALRADEDEKDLLFVGQKCDTYQQAIQKECKNDSDYAIFGIGIKRPRSYGVYYFETNRNAPYARG